MARNPSAEFTVSMVDYSDEISAHTLNTTVLTAANFDAQTPLRTNYLTALQAVTLGNITRHAVTTANTKTNAAAPTDADAQRERKWLVVYQDTTTFGIYRVEVPTAMLEAGDGTSWLLAGTDLVDLTVIEVAAYITAFEALALSPDGNATNVLEIIAVGRST